MKTLSKSIVVLALLCFGCSYPPDRQQRAVSEIKKELPNSKLYELPDIGVIIVDSTGVYISSRYHDGSIVSIKRLKRYDN